MDRKGARDLMEVGMVHGPDLLHVDLPDGTEKISPGLSLPLPAADDISEEVSKALNHPLDGDPLVRRVRSGTKVTIAFDDPTVPCYAPVWAHALPTIVSQLESAGVKARDMDLVCANSLHRKFTHEELARTIGEDFVGRHGSRMRCHDAEDPDEMVSLGLSSSGYDVTLGRCVVESDLVVYLNCSTMRGFSGGWKSICVGLSDHRSIRHHHTPDIMSMSLDRNQMHEMLDEMGQVVDASLGSDRIFKLETILANPMQVHKIVGGSVWATRKAVTDVLRSNMPARRDLLRERADVLVYGVPDWSPYAAFSHTNPILDIVSTGLGYLGGVIEGAGKPGCSVVLATPCPDRWQMDHHPSYKDAWDEVLPHTRDPEVIRHEYEPTLSRRPAHIEAYRFGNAFHPVHATMALYPLKRLRHAGEVIVAAPRDAKVPSRLGFASEPTVERGVARAISHQGPGARVAFIDNPMAFNRS